MKTHDFTKPAQRWGHSIGYQLETPDGHRLKAHGWGGGISDGDYLILTNGGSTTRYQVEGIRYMWNVHDQFFCTLVYAPRKDGEA
ncbi:hypothetical protein ACLE0S_000372 [Cronobacter malonaticus]